MDKREQERLALLAWRLAGEVARLQLLPILALERALAPRQRLPLPTAPPRQ